MTSYCQYLSTKDILFTLQIFSKLYFHHAGMTATEFHDIHPAAITNPRLFSFDSPFSKPSEENEHGTVLHKPDIRKCILVFNDVH